MLKASAGGGGKGMRVAFNDAEAIEGFNLSKQEAKASFGDDRMLIEKFITNPRHVEIQVLADEFGNCLYFPERECSIQRRNQKVLEEAPSPFLDQATRDAMGKQAVQLAKEVGYKSAGTVEFLVNEKKEFYFLEMNTRLQVEHPITEEITKVDLVKEMFDVAGKRELTLKQSDLKIHGWAMESRVYAEDPLRNFLPSIGTLTTYNEPTNANIGKARGGKQLEGLIRVDSGVQEGGEISVNYDPMISKLITHSATRKDTIEIMKHALDNYEIRGLNNNICFLRSMMENKDYVDGNLTTDFIPDHFPDGFHGHNLSVRESEELVFVAAALEWWKQTVFSAEQKKSDTFVLCVDGIEGATQIQMVNTDGQGESFELNVLQDGAVARSMRVTFDEPLRSTTRIVRATIVDKSGNKDIHQGDTATIQLFSKLTEGYRLQHIGNLYDVSVWTKKEFDLLQYVPERVKLDTGDFLLSPMPGIVLSTSVKVGDKVTEGQELCVVEAMKMQNVLRAGRDGVVKSVVDAGTPVAVDEVIIEFEKEEKDKKE